jgi:hypothetical protein
MIMLYRRLTSVLLGCCLLAIPGPGNAAAAPAKVLVALKQAGLGDQVIQAVVREKVIETAAFTVEELIGLKKAGMTDETLEAVITERSFMKQSRPLVYGRSIKPIQLSSVQDLIELKRSGVSDEVIHAIVVASSGRHDDASERAWEMLDRMGIEIEMHP